MKQNKKEVRIELPLPGFDKKDIKFAISKNKAIISAEKSAHNKIRKKGFFHEEKTYKSFSYSTTLPDINPEKAKTEFKNNILRITFPKKRKIKAYS